ncbi:MAG: trehalase family glycosidase, partial [Kiritimatiellaeota bacterium]|nr:trehalase family glycosidase [Kiritimatiellota bacterium]
MLGTLHAADFQGLEKSAEKVPGLGKNPPENSKAWKNGENNFQPLENAAGVQAVLAHIQKGFPQSIKVDKNGDADVVGLPHPYTSPCIKEGFQQQFYWDTYFINQGLLRIGLAEQARNNVNNLLLLTDQFGIVPSANRRSMANRSQTPFLSQMVRDVYQDKPDAAWLKSAVAVLKKDYSFWMTKRLAPCGLNRSGNDATEQYLMAFYYYLAKER